MKLQKVYIKNFRGIKEVFIDFREKINLLIGNNGCGKTTILEAVDLCFNGKLEQEDLHNLNLNKDNNCVIACIFDGNIKQDTTENENLNAIVHKTHIEDGDTKISQDKYLFQIDLGKSNTDKENLISTIEGVNKNKKLTKIQNATKKSEVKPISAIYYMPAIDLDDPSKSSDDKSMFAKVYENLNNIAELKEILSNYDSKAKEKTKDIFNDEKNGIKNTLKEYFKIENIDYKYNGSAGIKPQINIVNSYGDKTSKDLSHAGSGIRKIIKFIARLKFDGQQKSIFLIDEPEQNLHLDYQEKLIEFLKNESIQCIFTSHSSTFVKHCMNNEGCNVLICKKDEKGEIEVKNIREKIETNYKFLVNYTNSQAVANFLAFKEYTTDLFIYVYELLKQKALDSSEKKIASFLKTHNKEKEGEKWQEQRNIICHYGNEKNNTDENKKKELPTDDDIKQSIDEMIELLKK